MAVSARKAQQRATPEAHNTPTQPDAEPPDTELQPETSKADASTHDQADPERVSVDKLQEHTNINVVGKEANDDDISVIDDGNRSWTTASRS